MHTEATIRHQPTLTRIATVNRLGWFPVFSVKRPVDAGTGPEAKPLSGCPPHRPPVQWARPAGLTRGCPSQVCWNLTSEHIAWRRALWEQGTVVSLG